MVVTEALAQAYVDLWLASPGAVVATADLPAAAALLMPEDLDHADRAITTAHAERFHVLFIPGGKFFWTQSRQVAIDQELKMAPNAQSAPRDALVRVLLGYGVPPAKAAERWELFKLKAAR